MKNNAEITRYALEKIMFQNVFAHLAIVEMPTSAVIKKLDAKQTVSVQII